MSNDDTTPVKPRVGGLGPKAQKLQAMRDKLAQQKSGAPKQNFAGNAGSFKGNASAGHKKTNFQRKAT